MKHISGSFSEQQMKEQKKILHGSVHWLLLYKENNYDKLDVYFEYLLRRISGLNTLLKQPPELVTLLSTLQAAREELSNPKFDFHVYRKLILDSHSLIDQIKECD